MARPMLCNTCVGYEDDGRFWTKDQNGARWIVYEQPASKGLWSGYSDQYGVAGMWTPAVYLGPYPYDGLINAINIHGKANKANALKTPQNPYDVNFEVPYKSLPFSQAEGPPGPPAGWTPTDVMPLPIPGKPPLPTPPEPSETTVNPPDVQGGATTEEKEKKTDNTGLVVGVAAVVVALLVGTLRVK